MGLFKSKDERRIEREMKLKSGLRAIERSVRQQEKFAEDFIKNAQNAKRIGDQQQYNFIRGALKKTALVKRMLERQLLAMKNAMLISQQAEASRQFAESMSLLSRQVADVFADLDLTKTQVDWERAMAQAGSVEQRMELFLDTMETSASGVTESSASASTISDEEIDRMIETDVLAQEKAELSKLDELESEIAKELGQAKQKD
ncbi:MAG: hypothetical protein H7144_04780 [Burkholderiales bacterium]|nr:hypothetical protein [Phycisphaerae bacterium]